MDGLMHRVGLHGYAIIPTLLGLGCNVPAVMGTRILESKKERFIAATLISIGVPCAALQAMIFGLVGERGGKYVAIVYFTLFLVWLILGFIMSKAVKGYSPELIIEIPHYPNAPSRSFPEEAPGENLRFSERSAPDHPDRSTGNYLLYAIGIFHFLANLTAPIVTRLWGLPKESIVAILIGFLRQGCGGRDAGAAQPHLKPTGSSLHDTFDVLPLHRHLHHPPQGTGGLKIC